MLSLIMVNPYLRRAVSFTLAALGIIGGAPLTTPTSAARTDGTLVIAAADEETGEPLAVRLELRDARGRAVRLRPDGAVVLGESIYFDGEVTLNLRRGAYSFLIEAGPEYLTRPGNFTIDRHAEDTAEVTLARRIDMAVEGWWAGDLDVQVRLEDLPLMMKARGVDFAPVAALVNDQGRCRKLKAPRGAALAESLTPPLYGAWATLDNRRGGGLVAVSAQPPVDVCQWTVAESSMPSASAADDAGATVVALTPFAWDLPIWIAAGKLDAVQIINRHSQWNAAADNEGVGRPRDETFFPGPLGNGRYSETIYHHLLNCGLRLPPAAGSGTGAGSGSKLIGSPLGSNRTYVHCGGTCTRESWLEGLRAGRVIVTNGPLLRTRVDGELPGYVFQLYENERREFQIALDLAFYEANKVEYLEIIQNGRPIHQVRLDELAARQGKLPFVEFDTSGWFLVRAVTDNEKVYQYATTAPYYVESNHQPRISRASVQFFLTWLDDAAKKFAKNEAVLKDIEEARPFWQKLLARATVD
ncbi:MAG TPA: CehA/McbA family metallohydrolase [Lacipirellula sp.]